jgi:hypothetical protein
VPPETTTPPKYTSSQKFDVRGSRYRKSAEKTTQRRGVHTEGVQPPRLRFRQRVILFARRTGRRGRSVMGRG